MRERQALVGLVFVCEAMWPLLRPSDVRIKDHGLESIEVVDNGSGIDEVDWPSIGEWKSRY